MKRRSMMDNSTYLLRGISPWNVLLITVISFLLLMDVALYFRIQNYPLRKDSINTTEYPATCVEFSPFCYISVKGVLLDHVNLYVFGPMISIMDIIFRISDFTLITPNMISVFHVFVAILSGKCVSSHSLSTRRIGAVLFEIRTLLDGLDGHVARARKHIHGEASEVGSTGYIVDGVCDALGIAFLMLGIYVFLKNNPSRRDYIPQQTAIADKTDYVEFYRKKLINKGLLQVLGCIIAQLMLSSTAWNRYIALYQDLLDKPNVSHAIELKKLVVFRSNYFLLIAFLWRVFNVHSYLHVILLAIAYDKIWELFKTVSYIGFVVLLAIICLSEMHLVLVEGFIYGNVAYYHNNTSF